MGKSFKERPNKYKYNKDFQKKNQKKNKGKNFNPLRPEKELEVDEQGMGQSFVDYSGV